MTGCSWKFCDSTTGIKERGTSRVDQKQFPTVNKYEA